MSHSILSAANGATQFLAFTSHESPATGSTNQRLMALERVINTSSSTRSSVRKRLAAPTVASTGSNDAVKLSVPLAINSPTGGMVVDLGILDANGGGGASRCQTWFFVFVRPVPLEFDDDDGGLAISRCWCRRLSVGFRQCAKQETKSVTAKPDR